MDKVHLCATERTDDNHVWRFIGGYANKLGVVIAHNCNNHFRGYMQRILVISHVRNLVILARVWPYPGHNLAASWPSYGHIHLTMSKWRDWGYPGSPRIRGLQTFRRLSYYRQRFAKSGPSVRGFSPSASTKVMSCMIAQQTEWCD